MTRHSDRHYSTSEDQVYERQHRRSIWQRGLDLARSSLVGSSAVIFVGFAAASLLGFVFLVVAARLLGPSEFGTVAYALAVAELAAVLVTTAPLGLSTYLSRFREDRATAGQYYASWLTVVGAVLVLSVVVTAFIGPAFSITGWLLVGVLCNLLGVTALETYREVARGLDRYVLVSVFYLTSNLLQLVGILVAAALGYRSAALFVIIYGLAGVVTLIGLTLVSPLRTTFSLRSIQRRQMWEVLQIVQPVLLQSVFFTVWLRGDLVFVEHLQTSLATGQYGAAKTLTNALLLGPTAISFVFLPRVPRVPLQLLTGWVRRVLVLMATVTVPSVLVFVFGGQLIVTLLFGQRYEAAAAPLEVLAVGVGAFCFCSVFTNTWLGLRRPLVDTVTTGIGMACTLATAPVLIGRFGLVGAALAFSAGGVLRLVSLVAYTIPALRTITTQAQVRASAERGVRSVAVISEDPLGLPQEADHSEFTGELVRRLGADGAVAHLPLGRASSSNRFTALLQSLGQLLRAAHAADEVEDHPTSWVVYVPPPATTLSSFLRAKIIKLATVGPAVLMVALRPPAMSRSQAWVARLLWPDCVLVQNESDRQSYLSVGPRAAKAWDGVDLTQLRPAGSLDTAGE